MNIYLKRGLVVGLLVAVIAIAASRGAFLTVHAATAAVTSNISANATVGQPWTITISGVPGANVSVQETAPMSSTSGMGTLDSSGMKVITGTFSGSDLQNGQPTTWAETWLVGGLPVGNVDFTLSPTPPAITIATSGLPGATINSPYSVTLQGTVGSGLTPMWSLAGGTTLPPGLSLSSGGVISGIPTSLGAYAFKVSLSDGTQSISSLILSITVAIAVSPTTSVNPNNPTTVPSLDSIIKTSADLTAFIDSAAFEGVYWVGTCPGCINGGISGDYATEATAQALASAFGGTVVSEPAPPISDPAGYFLAPDGTHSPSQWFVQFPDGTLMNAGQLAQDYFMGAAPAQIKLNEAITDTAKAFTNAPSGSPIVTWRPDPSTDYSQWVGTDARGYTWSVAAGSSSAGCGLVAWTGPTIDTIPSNPNPDYTQTNGSNMTCMPSTSTSNSNGGGSTTSGATVTTPTTAIPSDLSLTQIGEFIQQLQQQVNQLLAQLKALSG